MGRTQSSIAAMASPSVTLHSNPSVLLPLYVGPANKSFFIGFAPAFLQNTNVLKQICNRSMVFYAPEVPRKMVTIDVGSPQPRDLEPSLQRAWLTTFVLLVTLLVWACIEAPLRCVIVFAVTSACLSTLCIGGVCALVLENLFLGAVRSTQTGRALEQVAGDLVEEYRRDRVGFAAGILTEAGIDRLPAPFKQIMERARDRYHLRRTENESDTNNSRTNHDEKPGN